MDELLQQDKKSSHHRVDVPKRWRWHYKKLMILRDLLQDHLINAANDRREQDDIPADSADLAAENVDLEVTDTICTADEQALTEVNAAILRILDGSYGVCESTGSYIPAARLRAVPWTRYSTDAARRIERQIYNGETNGNECHPKILCATSITSPQTMIPNR